MKVKNILFVQSSLNPSVGGIMKVSYNLKQGFKDKGIESYFAYFRNDTELIPEDHKFLFDEFDSAENLCEFFYNIIKEKNIDVIIHQDQNAENFQQTYRLLKNKTNIPIINCMHNQPDFNKYWRLGWRYKLTEFSYKLRHGHVSAANPYVNIYNLVDRFVLLSESFVPLAKKYYNLKDSSKLNSIPNPIIPIDKSSIIPFDKKKKQFLIVSRFNDHQKRITTALKIWQKFERLNEDYNLAIAGDGKERHLYENYAKQLGLKRVKFIGFIKDPSPLYNESKFFMMTSKYEGLPMTLIEAQQYGCIPFSFNSYLSLHDIVQDGMNGFIIQNNGIKKYANKMLEVINDVTLKNISINAIKHVSKFDLDKVICKWLSLFKLLKQ